MRLRDATNRVDLVSTLVVPMRFVKMPKTVAQWRGGSASDGSVPMPELACLKVDDAYILRDGAGIF